MAFVHAGLTDWDRKQAMKLYTAGLARSLVVPQSLCWGLAQAAAVVKVVVVMGTESYDGREKRYADYAATDLLQMVGLAGQSAGRGEGTSIAMATQIHA